MYYEYWNLKKSPFDNVPDPTMYAACHDSMENAIAETLFAIEEGEDCLSVIVGDVGLGKTMSIREPDRRKGHMTRISDRRPYWEGETLE